jgi:peptidoglycan hydrolase CwlO-like protein
MSASATRHRSAVETQDAGLAAKIEVVVGKVADLDKQLAQLDAAVATATQRGKANAGLAAVEGQQKARAALAGERERAAAALAALKMERAGVAAQERRIETESAPIVYVAQLLGVSADSEQAIRWLILLMVLTCDPLAIALTAAASARRAEP